jgi:uncharacterized protein (TIGR02147 family)
MMKQGYRDILRAAYEQRCRGGVRYSMRSFALELGISPATLSETMSGAHTLTTRMAIRIAAALKFSDEEARRFRDMVEAEHPRSSALRDSAQARLKTLAIESAGHLLSSDEFRVMSDWYYFAIMELTKIKGFRADPIWISRRLGVTPHEAGEAVLRLFRLGLLVTEDGRTRAAYERYRTTDGVPSEPLRNQHRQFLAKAAAAIDQQSLDERCLHALTLAMPAAALPRLKDMIRTFCAEVREQIGPMAGKDEVYTLSLQCTRLTRSRQHDG